MSLENALAENSAALLKLSALIADLMARPPIPDMPISAMPPAIQAAMQGRAEPPAPEVAVQTPKPKTPAPAAAQAASSAPTAEAAPAAVPATKPEPSADPLTYDQVKVWILNLSKKSRAQAVDLLADFGAKIGTDLKPEQYPAVVAKAQELLS